MLESRVGRRTWLQAAVVGAVAGCIPLVGYLQNGMQMRVSPDSANYLIGARSLLAGKGYLGVDGLHQTTWPPGYPALLATIGSVTGDLMVAALVVNVLSFAVIGAILVLLISRYVEGVWIAPIAALLAVANPAMWEVSDGVWSEPTSLALSVIAAYLMVRMIDHKSSAPWLGAVTFGAVLGLNGLVRFAAVLVAGAMLLALWRHRRPWWLAWVAGVLAAGIPVGWEIVNRTLGAPAGTGEGRALSAASPLEVGFGASVTVARWFTINPKVAPAYWWPPLLLVGAAAAAAAIALTIKAWRHLPVAVRAVGLAALLFGILMFGVRVVVAMDMLGHRLLVPLVPLAAVMFAVVSEQIARLQGWWVRPASMLALAGVLLGALNTFVKIPNRDDGISLSWMSLQQACRFGDDAQLLTNSVSHLALACETVVGPAPRTHLYQSTAVLNELTPLQDTFDSQCVRIVWAGGDEGGHYVPVPELEAAGFQVIDAWDDVRVLQAGHCGG